MTSEEVLKEHREECAKCQENFEIVPNCKECMNPVIIGALEDQILRKITEKKSEEEILEMLIASISDRK